MLQYFQLPFQSYAKSSIMVRQKSGGLIEGGWKEVLTNRENRCLGLMRHTESDTWRHLIGGSVVTLLNKVRITRGNI